MRTLFVHVGHSKTGSSYLQAQLASLADVLHERDAFYPWPNTTKPWNISSGNAAYALGLKQNEIPEIYASKVIISSDTFFQKMASNFEEAMKPIKDFACNIKAERIVIILFVRDPIEHAESAYQQNVKRGGETRDVDDFFDAYNFPKRVENFLKKADELGIETSLINYSRNKSRVFSAFCNVTGIDPKGFEVSEKRQVNRSLTRSELFIQRGFNNHLGRKGRVIADALCEEMPHLISEKVFPSLDAQLRMIERNRKAIDYINQQLDDQRYDTLPVTPSNLEEAAEVSPAQLLLLGETVGRKLVEAEQLILLQKAWITAVHAGRSNDHDEQEKLLELAQKHLTEAESLCVKPSENSFVSAKREIERVEQARQIR